MFDALPEWVQATVGGLLGLSSGVLLMRFRDAWRVERVTKASLARDLKAQTPLRRGGVRDRIALTITVLSLITLLGLMGVTQPRVIRTASIAVVLIAAFRSWEHKRTRKQLSSYSSYQDAK